MDGAVRAKIPGFYRLASQLKVLIKPLFCEYRIADKRRRAQSTTTLCECSQRFPGRGSGKGGSAKSIPTIFVRFVLPVLYICWLCFFLPRCRCPEKGWSLCSSLWRTIDVGAPYTIFVLPWLEFSKEIKRICLHRYSEFGGFTMIHYFLIMETHSMYYSH